VASSYRAVRQARSEAGPFIVQEHACTYYQYDSAGCTLAGFQAKLPSPDTMAHNGPFLSRATLCKALILSCLEYINMCIYSNVQRYATLVSTLLYAQFTVPKLYPRQYQLFFDRRSAYNRLDTTFLLSASCLYWRAHWGCAR